MTNKMKDLEKRGIVPADIPKKPNTNTGYVPPGIPRPAPKPPKDSGGGKKD